MSKTQQATSYTAFFSDPGGLPRAFGKAPTQEEAIGIAQLELEAFRDEKAALGDPLATAEFTLTVKANPLAA